MENWNKLSQPPKWALRTIQAGRLKGKSDINPQWRYKAMTEVYGPCGVGWKFEVDKMWTEPGPDNQMFAFVLINLFTKTGDEWSAPIPGVGGHMLIPKEKSGLHANDEAYKMATTDALSTAMKMLGVASAVYEGAWDGSKYAEREATPKEIPIKEIETGLLACETPEDLTDLWKAWGDTVTKAANKQAIIDLFSAKKAELAKAAA